MFHAPPLSPSASVTDRQSVVFGTAAPSQPRYFRDPKGKLKYAIEVDLNGFPEENISVTNVRNIINIDAKFVDVDVNGDERTHELRRELYLPANVDANSVTCVLRADGILIIEADAMENLQRPFSQPHSAQMSRLSTANYLASPTRFTSPPPYTPPSFDRSNVYGYNADPRRITFHESGTVAHSSSRNRSSISHFNNQPEFFARPPSVNRVSFAKFPTEYILKSSPAPRPAKNVRLVAPTAVNQSSNASNLQTTWKRGLSVSPERPSRQNLHFPYGNVAKSNHTNSSLGNKRFTLNVDVGPHVRPEDLSVSVQNGVVVISAKRFVGNKTSQFGVNRPNRMIYEHRSEHTLPAHVDPTDLTCRLANGIVSIDAPFSIGSSPNLGSVTAKNQSAKLSSVNSNAQKKSMNNTRKSSFPFVRAKNMWPGKYT
ncbi:unnamed protein product [Echinostoma caproni]|uniref:SHSP domain-containing protein n=1 Tax=Echinostoma caproni TaxID=27848 RepID=A0A183A5P0_9TREM|nr:unnamed protein product [Echinostoma caproni]